MRFVLAVLLIAGSVPASHAQNNGKSPVLHASRNVIVFVADGLRRGSVNAVDSPTLLKIRLQGVDFANSHSLFPTLTTPNASAIAVGHYLGDTGDFGNSEFIGFPIFNDGRLHTMRSGSPAPFLEDDSVIADFDEHFRDGNYLNEDALLALARHRGYNTAAIGKLGPVAIQDVTQLRPINGAIPARATVFIDDATGSEAGIPLSPAVQAALTAAGLPLATPRRDQPAGDAVHPGTRLANVVQQQYFSDATLKAVLPLFKASGRPFALIYWSRDPDGSQHNQGDSLNRLQPGINGPTSRAGVTNADQNLKAILDYLTANADVAANTDIFVTSDHGFATISKHEIDANGGVSQSYATSFNYLNESNDPSIPEVTPGWLPPGFLAIEIAHALSLPLFDPDSQVNVHGNLQYEMVDPSKPNTSQSRQHPANGSGLIGGSGAILDKTDASVIVAANGGADLIYVQNQDVAIVRKLVEWLGAQDYVGGLFVDSKFGALPGALPLKAVGLQGSALTPRPSIVVVFKTFATDPANLLQSAVQIADTTLQEGQGMHGSLGRDNTFNNMAAIGPDFKHGFVDSSPVSNADIARTLAHILHLHLRDNGHLQGRVLQEALVGGPDHIASQRHVVVSTLSPKTQHATVLEYQTAAGRRYYDFACLVGGQDQGRNVPVFGAPGFGCGP